MASSLFKDADSVRRKRSASQNPSPTFAVSFHSPKKVEISSYSPPKPSLRTTIVPQTRHIRKNSWEKQGRKHSLRSANMQSPTHSTFANSALPSFMTIYNSSLQSTTNPGDAQSSSDPESCFSPIDQPSFNPFHQPRNSTSTSASDSTDSSPTTTVSLDSSSITDSSPGASPQSPSSMSFAMDASRFKALDSAKNDSLTIPIEPPRPTTPAKKARNLKNLAVNTSAAYNLGRAIATAPLKTQDGPERTSAPASPAFVKPPTPPKRKLGKMNLTIMTPANSTLGVVPPTPSITRPATLRHFQSSPSLPLYTAGAGPTGGMQLPKIRAQPVPRGFAEIPQEDEEEDEQNFDVPQSQEDKPESYPNGPIRIYESGVDLYYEPSTEVASRYDVIFNVASEVKNPFDVEEEARKALQVPSNNVGIISENAGSPTTPKATPISTENPPLPLDQRKRPEYIHIPWEHNTDIVPDLHHLVRTIDDRVNQGKLVLVHCQCGVSRSASLIVAYGLYKNPDISVQEAYEAVKKRSKWIGPNMSLIMQLQEFKNGMTRNMGLPRQLAVLPSASSTIDSFDFESKSPSEPATPRTAPFNPDALESPDVVPSSLGPFSAGPIEPGSGFWDRAFSHPSWSNTTNKPLLPGSVVADTPYVDTKGHVVPMVAVLPKREAPSVRQVEKIADHPPTTFKKPNYSDLPLRRDYDTDIQMTDAPALPTMDSLLSPRSTEFHMTPLVPTQQVDNNDSYNLFSPKITEFPKTLTPKKPSLMDSPPPPKRAAPPPPREYPMESLNSIFSPTSTSFPSVQPLPLGGPLDRQFPERVDSLVPHPSPPKPGFLLGAPPPKKNTTPRKLRTKLSAPNLTQCRQLEKLQKEISSSLPARPAEAEEALMSPRVENFLGNPFHNFRAEPAIREEDTGFTLTAPEEQKAPMTPMTPGSDASDPRSPAQFGISPITRNIWGMI